MLRYTFTWALLTLFLAVSSNASGQSCMILTGEPDDYIWEDATTFDAAFGSFKLKNNYDGGVEATYDGLFPGGSPGRWALNLSHREKTTLSAASYYPALRYPFNAGAHGLDLNGSGRNCSKVFGSFTILELAYDDDGRPVRLAVDFEQHCENLGRAVLGQVRVNTCGKQYAPTCIDRLYAARSALEASSAPILEVLSAATSARQAAQKAWRKIPVKCRKGVAKARKIAALYLPKISDVPEASAPKNGFVPYAEFQRCEERVAFLESRQTAIVEAQQKLDVENAKSTRLAKRYKSARKKCLAKKK